MSNPDQPTSLLFLSLHRADVGPHEPMSIDDLIRHAPAVDQMGLKETASGCAMKPGGPSAFR